MAYFYSPVWEGMVRIHVNGRYPERFISIGTRKGISFYQIVRNNKNSITLTLKKNEIFLLRPILKKTGCRFRILQKSGLPFLIGKIRKRKGFVWGMVACIVLFFTLHSFLWGIEVSGNTIVSTQKVYDVLAKEGIRPGTIRYNVDAKNAAKALLMELEDISWAFVQIKGTKAKVSLAERKQKPKIVSMDPCDLIAKKDGLISNIIVKAGEAKVHVGQVVRKGDVLVSGVLIPQIEGTAPRKVHSMGSIEAKTWYSKTIEAPWKIKKFVRTGKEETRYEVLWKENIIKFKNEGSNFAKYDTIKTKTYVFSNVLGKTLGIQKTQNYELVQTENKIDTIVALQEALEIGIDAVTKSIPQDAKEKTKYYHILKKETNWQIEIVSECEEDIVQEAELKELPQEEKPESI